MIIKSQARQLGGLAAHLLNGKTNEHVSERRDLDRDSDHNLHTALLDFAFTAKLSNSNPRARSLFHIKVSPSHILTESELMRTIEFIEAEHNIPQSTPRKVIEHLKGNRAKHYHLVYSHYNPISGNAICTKRNHTNDEMASRLCEIEFNEPIVVGKHTEDNAKVLEARNLPEKASKLRQAMSIKAKPSEERSIISYNDADRLKKSVPIENRIWELFIESNRNISRFKAAVIKAGFAFATGDKAILITDPETRINIPLLRLINKRTKANGLGAGLKKTDLDQLAKDEPLPPVKMLLEEYTTRKINHIKRRAIVERELLLQFNPRLSVEKPVDPEYGKRGKPTIQSIEMAIAFNRRLQELLRQKLLALMLKKKIIRRLTKRLEQKSPRGMALFLMTETRSKMNANEIAIMASSHAATKPSSSVDANKIATMKAAHDPNATVKGIQSQPKKIAVSNKSTKLKKHNHVKLGIER